MKCLITLALALVLQIPSADAELKLATLFADHMVLQREKPVPVWGWADPKQEVVVSFLDQKVSVVAEADGKWMAKLAPLTASAEPTVLGIHAGDEKVEITDVLVGEVWLGSGQSNMAMTVGRSLDVEASKKDATGRSVIRMFKVAGGGSQKVPRNVPGSWSVCSSDTVGDFSATLYFMGRELHDELGVPVGLINSSVGGTPIEAWIDRSAQEERPELAPFLKGQLQAEAALLAPKAREKYAAQVKKWETVVAKAKAEGKKPLPRKPRDPLDKIKRTGGVGGLFNGKIAPLVPYAIRGAVWYQGEANSHPGKGGYYQWQMPLLIDDWRKRWDDEFPFGVVQLPDFQREGEGWQLVREGMLKTMALPKTGLAVTIGLGHAKDIHPKNKQGVGHRLAAWALGEVYGKDVPATCGPLFAESKKVGSEIQIHFTHGEGLKTTDGGAQVKGFVISGADRKWHPAKAVIKDGSILVSSPDVPAPLAVRHAWDPNPEWNLVNGADFPASPFRTDDWAVPGSGL